MYNGGLAGAVGAFVYTTWGLEEFPEEYTTYPCGG
jgi:hypothetical protein